MGLQDFSLQFTAKKIPECPSAPFIRNEAELAQVMQAIQKRVIGPLKAHEFFLCEVPQVVKEQFIPAIQKLEQAELEDYKEKFERDGWFLKNHFELIRDKLTVGHGSGPKTLVIGRKHVGIMNLETVGHYALRIIFDDMHDSGLYSWSYLYQLGTEYETRWAAYLTELEVENKSREP